MEDTFHITVYWWIPFPKDQSYSAFVISMQPQPVEQIDELSVIWDMLLMWRNYNGMNIW